MSSVFISNSQVEESLPYPNLIAGIERILIDFSSGPSPGIQQPQRGVIKTADQTNTFFTMPAYSQTEGMFVTKVITFFPNSIPSHQGVLLLFDGRNGCPLAIMEPEVLTARRTAALSVVASLKLAPHGSRCLAVLGAGTQGESHIDAHLTAMKGLQRVHIWNRTRENAQKLADKLKMLYVENSVTFHIFDHPSEAVAEADIVCCTSSTTAPILNGDWMKRPGVHVNAVGACRPEWQQIETNVLESATIVVESRSGAQQESGDIIANGGRVDVELGEVAAGKCADARGKRTVFKSLGMAVEDLVAAKIVYEATKSKSKI